MVTDNNDLLTEILLWLPAKSLIRFKLVCKRWFSIISNGHFSRRHTLHHRRRPKPEPSLLLRLAETQNYFYLQCGRKWVPYHFCPTLIEPTIWSFSNGLFLLHCSSDKNPLADCHVYNPTTRESRKILLNSNDHYRCVMGLNLAFDPLKSPHYRIVCVRATRRRSTSFWRSWWRRCLIEVYESDTSTWKLCGEPFLATPDVDFNHGIYWKGCIHWRGIVFDLPDSSVHKHPEVVLRGDIGIEIHPEVVLPGDIGIENLCDNYTESGSALHYIAHFAKEKLVMVFELQSNYSQWLLKYRINLDAPSEPLSVLSFIKGETDEDSLLVLHEPSKVMAYNFQEKSVKELIDFTEEAFYQDCCIQFVSNCTFQFIETLAPV